ncbi:VP2 minor structural protein [Norovirus dog/GVI.1/HKU_Ca026F/2007/HKG]|uniref:VP2 minor structural protein n=2 Tax=Norovirus GIV.1 TaxID=1160947 RepID=J7EH31_NORV|nr:VP2 minor structural protein [Norovirus dog/GVI.1/HKU_Ca026F/2007/HKG]ACV89841.1 VP2 minor structural protein [Norovirus dog/GVI.1/HKU_Ca026F/2007/HKG]ACV89844.1 VP2 minor structural protein [Norovirus dog/GVI.1/HKU_Ca035F/2007/HKG]
MASAILGAIGGAGLDVVTNSLSSLAQAGAQSILQHNEFQYNQALQQNSFLHDKEMLAAQVQATKDLQGAMLGIKHQALLAGGFSNTDAARGSIGAPMTKLVDWNGTRYWAPGAMSTTTFSGTPTPILRGPPVPLPSRQSAPSLYSSSWGAPQASRTTVTSRLTPSSRGSLSSTGDGGGTMTSASSLGTWSSIRTPEPPRVVEPFLPGSLRIAPSPSVSSVGSVSTVNQSLVDSWKPPPRARSSVSSGSVSTVDLAVLDSWKPSSRRMPLFFNLRRGHAE